MLAVICYEASARRHPAAHPSACCPKKCRASVRAWGTRLAKQGVINPDVVDWVVEPKVDGLAVRLLYR